MGKNFILITNGLSECTETRADFDPIKKGRPDYPFSVNFCRRPDKKLSVQSPRAIGLSAIGIRYSVG